MVQLLILSKKLLVKIN